MTDSDASDSVPLSPPLDAPPERQFLTPARGVSLVLLAAVFLAAGYHAHGRAVPDKTKEQIRREDSKTFVLLTATLPDKARNGNPTARLMLEAFAGQTIDAEWRNLASFAIAALDTPQTDDGAAAETHPPRPAQGETP